MLGGFLLFSAFGTQYADGKRKLFFRECQGSWCQVIRIRRFGLADHLFGRSYGRTFKGYKLKRTVVCYQLSVRFSGLVPFSFFNQAHIVLQSGIEIRKGFGKNLMCSRFHGLIAGSKYLSHQCCALIRIFFCFVQGTHPAVHVFAEIVAVNGIFKGSVKLFLSTFKAIWCIKVHLIGAGIFKTVLKLRQLLIFV